MNLAVTFSPSFGLEGENNKSLTLTSGRICPLRVKVSVSAAVDESEEVTVISAVQGPSPFGIVALK